MTPKWFRISDVHIKNFQLVKFLQISPKCQFSEIWKSSVPSILMRDVQPVPSFWLDYSRGLNRGIRNWVIANAGFGLSYYCNSDVYKIPFLWSVPIASSKCMLVCNGDNAHIERVTSDHSLRTQRGGARKRWWGPQVSCNQTTCDRAPSVTVLHVRSTIS